MRCYVAPLDSGRLCGEHVLLHDLGSSRCRAGYPGHGGGSVGRRERLMTLCFAGGESRLFRYMPAAQRMFCD